ncbi:MAG: glycine--tRNA ligase subunit beta [Xanthomonadales bacterium]|nr:glycine--tRNA ligase subunit beta [Xanthomonadales bacterium]
MSEAAKVARADLLIEIGCEELPPKALDQLRIALFEGVSKGLQDAGIEFDASQSQSWSTPRRLALFFAATASSQPDQDQERRGPAAAAAFDADGKATQAALGFARSAGVEMAQMETLQTDKGAWLVARSHIKGKALSELLYPILEQALKQLPIPRPMRWADHDFSFIRPVHWLLVLHGETVLPGVLFGLNADRLTRGHRVHSPGPQAISLAGDYLRILEEANVLADQQVRKDTIERMARNTADTVQIDPDLLDEVNNLVEWPSAILCSFDVEFLAVPHKALIASMQDHQKFFPVTAIGADAKDHDSISNRFIAIANLDSVDPDQVRQGFERVIRPRLADARFFLEQDQKKPLIEYADALDEVVFQNKIGSLGAKSRRMASISEQLATHFNINTGPAKRAAALAKCDLLTQMVGEFPELQGYMGRQYALHSGEDPGVAAAIEEYYQPRFAGDVIPASKAGQLLSLADRADTLVGIFAADLRPSGNKDPFALRRSALGLVRILLEAKLKIAPRRLFELAAEQFRQQGVDIPNELLTDLESFVLERARSYFHDSGVDTNLITAALASNWTDLADLAARLGALAGFMGQESALSLAAANKRIANILRKSGNAVSAEIAEDKLILDEEKLLFSEIVSAERTLEPLFQRADYQACLNALAGLRPVVDRFFDGVMVMDKDPELQRNRLALLARLKALFDGIADVSVLA